MVKWSYDDKRTRELPRCLLVRSNATELFVNHHRYVPGLCGDVLRRTESTTVQDDEPCLSALVGRLRSSGNRAFIGVEASKARVISHPPKHSEVLRPPHLADRYQTTNQYYQNLRAWPVGQMVGGNCHRWNRVSFPKRFWLGLAESCWLVTCLDAGSDSLQTAEAPFSCDWPPSLGGRCSRRGSGDCVR